MAKKKLKDLEVSGKKILMRVDFNVPFSKNDRQINDDTRIQAALPSIRYLLQNKAKLILMSHAGRPEGQKNADFSLKPIQKHLANLTQTKVHFAEDCIGQSAKNTLAELKEGEILLLENLRFYSQETNKDAEFAQKLASLADIFVNDAFGTAHRAHASTVGVPAFIGKGNSAMGFLLERELKYLIEELYKPKKPFLVILGGAKVSDKIGVINALLEKADAIIIGGAMAYTFAKALGEPVGQSLVEEDKLDLALELLQKAKAKNTKLILPKNSLEADKFDASAQVRMTLPYKKSEESGGITDNWLGVDIGDLAIEKFCYEISQAKTIVWNGPMGVFEIEKFALGTKAIAEAVANADAITIIGGGDSVSAIKKFNLHEKVTFISTGGGASLELLEGKKLPGVEALSEI